VGETLDYPVVPEDALVSLAFNGSVKQVQMHAGETAMQQALEAQKAFDQTLQCRPTEKSGDTYVIRVTRPEVFSSTIVRGDTRVKTWVGCTTVKTILAEAQIILGNVRQTD
jgi:hypothetical protein